MKYLQEISAFIVRHDVSQVSRWWQRLLLAHLIAGLMLPDTSVVADDLYNHKARRKVAQVNITYLDLKLGRTVTESGGKGTYGRHSRIASESGMVVHVRDRNHRPDGCLPPVNVPGGNNKWIALVRRGGCRFTQKIRNVAVNENASAVVIYDNQAIDEGLVLMDQSIDDVVSIFIKKKDGEHIAQLVDNGTKVTMYITVGSGEEDHHLHQNMNKTSVIFVSVSFIVLIIISLGWLVFYYIQRFRYAHAKERLSKRLTSAAKKAVTKMPLRTLKPGDKETVSSEYQCAVCIEGYRNNEVVRILPCHHFFHKSCVDPWLIEQRNCPMCKIDILKAYGLQVRGDSQENISSVDREGASIAMLPTDSSSDTEICPPMVVQVEKHETDEPQEESAHDPLHDSEVNETRSLMPPSPTTVAPSQSQVQSFVTHHTVDAAVTTSTTVPATML